MAFKIADRECREYPGLDHHATSESLQSQVCAWNGRSVLIILQALFFRFDMVLFHVYDPADNPSLLFGQMVIGACSAVTTASAIMDVPAIFRVSLFGPHREVLSGIDNGSGVEPIDPQQFFDG